MAKPLAGLGVVITRPQDQAGKLSLAIEHEGGTAILFPMIAIAPLNDYHQFEETLEQLKHADWAIFISSNAVQNAFPHITIRYPKLPKQLKFAAIGPQTATELTLHGVKNVLIPATRFDSEALLALNEMHHVSIQKVVIFRGIGGREVLADTLKARGAEVIFAECYQRVNPQSDCSLIERLWQEGQCHAMVVTSSEAMRYLIKMTHNATDHWIRQIKICVNHARIAEDITALELQVFVAEAPGDEAMLRCLQHALLNQ